MARKRDSVFDDLVAIAARLPPWASILLALVFYFVFHYFAVKPVEPNEGVGIATLNINGLFLHTFSKILQYLVPFCFLLGALVSAIRGWCGKKLVDHVKKQSDAVAVFNWREFELLVTTLLRGLGFSVTDNLEAGPDGGIDQILRKEGKTYLVQCKHWKTRKVGVSVIREMFGLMVAEGADEVWVIASGSFTAEAQAFAQGKPIKLIDGEQLHSLSDSKQVREPKGAYQKADNVPNCPSCGTQMVKRMAKRGSNEGNEFWGCTGFPKCKGTLKLKGVDDK